MKKGMFIILIMLGYATTCMSTNSGSNNIFDFKKSNEQHKTFSSAVGISVNSNNEIALGFRDGYINVYDSNGKYKYGYSFNLNGSYVFNYDELNNIMIFPIRADGCYFFNAEAELVETREISNQVEKERYYRTLENKRIVSVKGNIYELRQSLGYTELTKIDDKGNKTVIYDIGWNYTGKILIGILVLIFAIVSILTIASLSKKRIDKLS